MSQNSSVCIICKKGTAPSNKLIRNPEMIKNLASCCDERLSLGQNDIKELCDCLRNLTDSDLNTTYYHSECRKPLVNMQNIETIRVQFSSCGGPAKGRGCPSTSNSESTRPKRVKTLSKEEICIF